MTSPQSNTTWNDVLLTNPHEASDKRDRVRKMFAAIAPTYDLNNRLHSLWQDQRWRRKAVKLANLTPNDAVVDVACGTGDLTLAFANALVWRDGASNAAGRILGIDFTFEMLPLAREKWRFDGLLYARPTDPGIDPSIYNAIQWLNGDAQSLPLPDQSADVVSIAFGIRNVQDPAAALREFHRVLRQGGRVIILEFSLPTKRMLRSLYNFYFRRVLPRTATWISGDKTGAYKYLPQSVNTFMTRARMMQMMRDAGFEDVQQFPMTCGVCVCYRGVKNGTADERG